VGHWLQLKGRSLVSLERCETALNHVLPVLGSKPLQRITVTDLDELFGAPAGKLGPRSLRSLFVTTKACLAAAVKKVFLAANPADKAERPAAEDN
jgi:hypothetical protein